MARIRTLSLDVPLVWQWTALAAFIWRTCATTIFERSRRSGRTAMPCLWMLKARLLRQETSMKPKGAPGRSGKYRGLARIGWLRLWPGRHTLAAARMARTERRSFLVLRDWPRTQQAISTWQT